MILDFGIEKDKLHVMQDKHVSDFIVSFPYDMRNENIALNP